MRFLDISAVYTLLAAVAKSNPTQQYGGFVAAVCFQLTASLIGGWLTQLAQRRLASPRVNTCDAATT